MSDLVVREQAVSVFSADDPELALEQARKVANAAMRMIEREGLVKQLGGGRPYVMVDGWLCIGRLAGATTEILQEDKLRDDSGNVIRDEAGRPFGWEARIGVYDRTGQKVADASAQCARDEKNWKTRDDYALRSMAQTRATGKAMRAALGFVAVMAGFESTPAEEMPDDPDFRQAPKKKSPKTTKQTAEKFLDDENDPDGNRRRAMADAGGAAGEVVIPGGPHQGKTIAEVWHENPGYVTAIARSSKDEGVKQAAMLFLEKQKQAADDPSLPF